MPEEEEYSNV
jgi:hypothetical protein